jgi:hypothetical protein
MIPRVTPRGFLCDFPVTLTERIMGKSGQIQGAKIVTNPAKKAKKSKRIIVSV